VAELLVQHSGILDVGKKNKGEGKDEKRRRK
jgi:hypothetical protein